MHFQYFVGEILKIVNEPRDVDESKGMGKVND